MRHRLLAVAILSSLALPAFAADTAAGPGPGQALQCGNLFDSRSGKLLGAHTVVVRDGKVAEVLQPGANHVYVVRGPLGEVLIPAIGDVVDQIDIAAGRIVITPLPGLLDTSK